MRFLSEYALRKSFCDHAVQYHRVLQLKEHSLCCVQIQISKRPNAADHAVCGLSIEVWLIKELRIAVLAANRSELWSKNEEFEPPSRSSPVAFITKHFAIPTTEPASTIVLEILKGALRIAKSKRDCIDFSLFPPYFLFSDE